MKPDAMLKVLSERHLVALFLVSALLLAAQFAFIQKAENSDAAQLSVQSTSQQQATVHYILREVAEGVYSGSIQHTQNIAYALAELEARHQRIVAEVSLVEAGRTNAEISKSLEQSHQQFVFLTKQITTERVSADQKRVQLQMLATGPGRVLLDTLDTATDALSAHAGRYDRALSNWHFVALLASLAILISHHVFVFLPARRMVSNHVQSLSRQADRDVLTDLANRKCLERKLSRYIDQDTSHGAGVIAIAIDLDGFKQVNDTLGHPVGDLVLLEVAEILRDETQHCASTKPPIVARLGGDEFVVILAVPPANALHHLKGFTNRLLARVQEPLVVRQGQDLISCDVGMSIGCAFLNQAERDADAILGNADIALYEAKRTGKRRAITFTADLKKASEHHQRLESDLRRAIFGSKLSNCYQPVFDISTTEIIGIEAFSLWKHPSEGYVPTKEYISIAESSGLIDMIDGSTILRGLEEYKAFYPIRLMRPKLTFNVSMASLLRPRFATDLSSTCAMFAVDTTEVIIELQETALLTCGIDTVADAISCLSFEGFEVAVDNFGADVSSLSVLTDLDIRSVRLDKSLTHRLGEAEADRFVTSVLALGERLGIEVSAKGIDTGLQSDRLQALGVKLGQGPLFKGRGKMESTMSLRSK